MNILQAETDACIARWLVDPCGDGGGGRAAKKWQWCLLQDYLGGLQAKHRGVQGEVTSRGLALAASSSRAAKLVAKLGVLRSVVAAVEVTPEQVPPPTPSQANSHAGTKFPDVLPKFVGEVL